MSVLLLLCRRSRLFSCHVILVKGDMGNMSLNPKASLLMVHTLLSLGAPKAVFPATHRVSASMRLPNTQIFQYPLVKGCTLTLHYCRTPNMSSGMFLNYGSLEDPGMYD